MNKIEIYTDIPKEEVLRAIEKMALEYNMKGSRRQAQIQNYDPDGEAWDHEVLKKDVGKAVPTPADDNTPNEKEDPIGNCNRSTSIHLEGPDDSRPRLPPDHRRR